MGGARKNGRMGEHTMECLDLVNRGEQGLKYIQMAYEGMVTGIMKTLLRKRLYSNK